MEIICIPARGSVLTCVGLSLAGALLALLFAVLGVQESAAFHIGALLSLGVVVHAMRSYRGSVESLKGTASTALSPLGRRIKACLRISDRATYRALLREFDSAFPAALICIGTVRVPEPRAFRDEPRVYPLRGSLTPAMLLIAGVLAARIIIELFLPARPVLMMFNTVLFGAVIATIVVTALYWFWSSGRFLRIAPGIIQVIRTRSWGEGQVEETYPMERGTLAVLRVSSGRIRDVNPTMTVFRPDGFCCVPLRQVNLDRLLKDITSTVQTDAARLPRDAPIG